MNLMFWVYNLAGARFGGFDSYDEAEKFRMLLGLSGPIVFEV